MPEPDEEAALLGEQQPSSTDPTWAQQTGSAEPKSSAEPFSLLSAWQALKSQEAVAASLQPSPAPTVVTGPTLVTGPTIVTGISQERPISARQTFEELLPGHQSLIPYPELPSIPSSLPTSSYMQLADMRDTAFASVPSSSIPSLPGIPTGMVPDHRGQTWHKSEHTDLTFSSIQPPQPFPIAVNQSPLKHSLPQSFTRPPDGMSSHLVPASVSPSSHRIYGTLAAALRAPESRSSLDAASPTGRATITNFPGRNSFAEDSQPLLVESPRVSYNGAPWLHYQVPPITHAEQSGAASGHRKGSYANDITLGVINFVIALPVTIAFARITYSHPTFSKVQPQLSRLLIAANATHSFVGALLSRLPFAVAQVQDLGLIFLNAMTSDIANRLEGEPHEVIVGTAVVACSLATILLGLVLIFIGKKKLTGIVAYIPQPVVAGYLGYVGYFCLTAGIAQGTSLPIHDPSSWILLLTRPDAYTKELATFACYGAILASIKLVKSQAGLPLVLMLIPVTWYALLGCVCMVEGVSWHELQLRLADTGWVSVMQGGGHEPFWKMYELFNLFPFAWSNISWMSILRQVPTAIALALVCSFGTPMDIVAVQAQVEYEIDSDYEVSTIGYANLAAGLFAGGGTGSYIFSQCLLALNGGSNSRAGGFTISSLQLLTFLLPVSLVHLLPNFYYGGLLVLIGTEIIYSWLFLTYWRITKAEFVLSWLTFLSVIGLCGILPVQGLEAGLLVGVILCALHFAYEYSLMQLVSMTVLPSRSHAMLPFRYQQVLALFQDHITAVSVSGYIFFGSMVEISRRLRIIADSVARSKPLEDTVFSPALGGPPLQALEPLTVDAANSARTAARRFLLLDLRRVTGIDATTATSFASLSRSLTSRGVTMVLTGLRRQENVQRMLVVHNVISTDGAWEGTASCPAFESMDEAIMWCEHHFKEVAMMSGLMDDPLEQKLSLVDVLRMHIDPALLAAISSAGGCIDKTVSRLESYMKRALHRRGTVLFDIGDASDTLYIVLSGGVASVFDHISLNGAPTQLQEQPSRNSCTSPQPNEATTPPAEPGNPNPLSTGSTGTRGDHAGTFRAGGMVSMHMHSTKSSGSIPGYDDPARTHAVAVTPGAVDLRVTEPGTDNHGRGRVQIVEAGPGAVIGGLDYTLSRKRSFQCLVTADATVMYLSRSSQQRMARLDAPAMAALQQMLLRSSLLTTAQALAMFENARL